MKFDKDSDIIYLQTIDSEIIQKIPFSQILFLDFIYTYRNTKIGSYTFLKRFILPSELSTGSYSVYNNTIVLSGLNINEFFENI